MCETLSINMLQLLTENQLFEWQQIEMCKHLLKIMRPWHWMGTGWMKYICVLGVLGQNLLPERFNNVSTATFSLNSFGVNTQFSCMEFWRVFPWRRNICEPGVPQLVTYGKVAAKRWQSTLYQASCTRTTSQSLFWSIFAMAGILSFFRSASLRPHTFRLRIFRSKEPTRAPC